MRTLGVIRATTPAPRRDLWPRLRARVAADEERVSLDLPAFGWRWGAAVALATGVLALVPEPLRFLTSAGLL